MAPSPKGGKGGSSFGKGGSSSSNDDDYDSSGSNYFGDNEDYDSSISSYYGDGSDAVNSIRASIAFAFLVMIAAIATSIMVLQKSWLRADGARDKSRMFIFLALALFSLISQASFAGYGIELLTSAPTVDAFIAGAVIGRVFEWLASITLFLLVLYEVTRSPELTHPKAGLVEKANYGLIGFLAIIGLISWATFASYFSSVYNNPYADYLTQSSTLLASAGTQITFSVFSFIFAFEMLVLGIMAFVGKKLSKSRGILLLVFLAVFWLHRLIALADSSLSFTLVTLSTSFGLACFLDVLWIAMLILLALLARGSHKMVTTGEHRIVAAAATSGQADAGTVQTEKSDVPPAPTPMTATSGPVSSMGSDGQQQIYYQQPQQQQYVPTQEQYAPTPPPQQQQQQVYNQYPVQDAPQQYQQQPQQTTTHQPYTEMPVQNAPPQQSYTEMPTTVAAPQADVQHPPQHKA